MMLSHLRERSARRETVVIFMNGGGVLKQEVTAGQYSSREEIIKVYTKYDTPCAKVIVPVIRYLTQGELLPPTSMRGFDQTGLTSTEVWELKSIEEGLEGVRFFHYAN